jgi:hypothetical protein
MELPGWLPMHGVVTAFAFVARFLIAGTPVAATGNLFTTIVNLIAFQGITGLPSWAGFVFFVCLSLPWLLLFASMLLWLAQSSITGLAAVALLAIGAVALVGLF